MTVPKAYIVLQCYGIDSVFIECTMALLSLSRLYTANDLKHTEIWIYTDRPDYFRSFKDCWLPLHYRVVDKALIQQWRGDINFVHRVKIELLLDFIKEREGNVLYCDTDIIFTHKLDAVCSGVTSGQLFMHLMEGRVSDRGNMLLAKLDTFLRSARLPAINGRELYDFNMWNAGILGFNTRHRQLLTDALAFTDAMFPKFPKHVIEQFAFSVQFQSHGEVKSVLPYIIHYWNFKDVRKVFGAFLDHFKEASWDDLTRYSSMLQVYDLLLEKTRFLYNRTLKEKLLRKPWQPEKRDWDAMVAELSGQRPV